MIVVGLLYTFQCQMRIDEFAGGSPYGISTIAGGEGERLPSENELAGARFQGGHVAIIASKGLRRYLVFLYRPWATGRVSSI
jgi:NAD(P)H dehydrogenase (quinone)